MFKEWWDHRFVFFERRTTFTSLWPYAPTFSIMLQDSIMGYVTLHRKQTLTLTGTNRCAAGSMTAWRPLGWSKWMSRPVFIVLATDVQGWIFPEHGSLETALTVRSNSSSIGHIEETQSRTVSAVWDRVQQKSWTPSGVELDRRNERSVQIDMIFWFL